jgi:hypothetical protein
MAFKAPICSTFGVPPPTHARGHKKHVEGSVPEGTLVTECPLCVYGKKVVRFWLTMVMFEVPPYVSLYEETWKGRDAEKAAHEAQGIAYWQRRGYWDGYKGSRTGMCFGCFDFVSPYLEYWKGREPVRQKFEAFMAEFQKKAVWPF